jgi:hypothetical protein
LRVVSASEYLAVLHKLFAVRHPSLGGATVWRTQFELNSTRTARAARWMVKRRRQSLMDKFVDRVAPSPSTIVWWGNGYAGVKKASKGRRPGLVRTLRRHLSRVRRVVSTWEWNTSKAHSGCLKHMVTHPQTHIVKKGAAPFAGRRGGGGDVATSLKEWKKQNTRTQGAWKVVLCPACDPSAKVDRDSNAALNILTCGLALALWGGRPAIFCPANSKVKMELEDDRLQYLIKLAATFQAFSRLSSSERRRLVKPLALPSPPPPPPTPTA